MSQVMPGLHAEEIQVKVVQLYVTKLTWLLYLKDIPNRLFFYKYKIFNDLFFHICTIKIVRSRWVNYNFVFTHSFGKK